MADIKVKDGFSRSETGNVVNTTELFDTVYEPIIV